MGCDLVVALGRATVDGCTLFGHNSGRPAGEIQNVRRMPGRMHALGEKIQIAGVELPQPGQTYTVLGIQPAAMYRAIAAGSTNIALRPVTRSCLRGLLPMDSALRAATLSAWVWNGAGSAGQAAALVTDLIARHGQSAAKRQASSGHYKRVRPCSAVR